MICHITAFEYVEKKYVATSPLWWMIHDTYIIHTCKVHRTEQWSVKSHVSLCWSLDQWHLSQFNFSLQKEGGGCAVPANNFRSPGNMKLISSQIFARRCCQEEQRARERWETALSRPLCLLNTHGSPDTHKSIMEEALNQTASVWMRVVWPSVS